MKVTASNLTRWAGLSAVVAGLLFVVVQMIHPADTLAAVTTPTWAIVHFMTIAMCLFGMVGLAGIYIRQAKEAGWLGLAGYLLYSLFLAFTMAFVFIEALISPRLAASSPEFVQGLLDIISTTPNEVDLGLLPVIYLLTGFFFVLGGVLFGTATFRAGILPRWAGVMLAGTLLPAVLPHDIVRLAAFPVGLGLAWMGYALWSERREKTVAAKESPQLRHAEAR